jgi:hypothetical protein
MAAASDGADSVTLGRVSAVALPAAALAITARSLEWMGDEAPPIAQDTPPRHRKHAPATVSRRLTTARPLVSVMGQAEPRTSARPPRSSASRTSRPGGPGPSTPPRDLTTSSAVTSASGGGSGTGSGAAWTGMLLVYGLGACLLTRLLASSRRWHSTSFLLLPERPG